MLGRRRAASTGTPLVTTLPHGTWAPWTATTGRPDPGLVGTACLVVLTLGISAATLRYRLYDLDRIISRTLAYGLLTLLLGSAYAAIVLGLGRLLPQGSSLSWPAPPWPSRGCSSRPGAASRPWWTGASTAAGTTPPRPLKHSAFGSVTRST
jgi:hypothetical protein